MSKNNSKQYDLEERTAIFAENSVKFAKSLPNNAVNRPMITQFIKASTSIGANYCEADDAESRKDFKHKIAIAKKEARETKYWLRIIVTAVPNKKDEARKLWQEAKELHLILNKIVHTTNKNLQADK